MKFYNQRVAVSPEVLKQWQQRSKKNFYTNWTPKVPVPKKNPTPKPPSPQQQQKELVLQGQTQNSSPLKIKPFMDIHKLLSYYPPESSTTLSNLLNSFIQEYSYWAQRKQQRTSAPAVKPSIGTKFKQLYQAFMAAANERLKAVVKQAFINLQQFLLSTLDSSTEYKVAPAPQPVQKAQPTQQQPPQPQRAQVASSEPVILKFYRSA